MPSSPPHRLHSDRKRRRSTSSAEPHIFLCKRRRITHNQDFPLSPPRTAFASPTSPRPQPQLRPQSPSTCCKVSAAISASNPPPRVQHTPPRQQVSSPSDVCDAACLSPIISVAVYDPDFGDKVCRAYELKQQMKQEAEQFNQRLREGIYGLEVARKYHAGHTPPSVRGEYLRQQQAAIQAFEDGDESGDEVEDTFGPNDGANQGHRAADGLG